MNRIDPGIYVDFIPWPLDLRGWHGRAAVFGDLIEKLKPNRIIEVGTWKGQSALHMVDCLRKRGLQATIVCVDTWLGSGEFWSDLAHTPERNLHLRHGYPSIYYQFLSNVIHMKAQNYIMPFPATSLIAARVLRKQGFVADMIYIDASHDEKDVADDLEEYWKLLRVGGVVFGDDINWKTALGSIRNAVEGFCKARNVEFKVIDNCFWVIEKLSDSSSLS